MLKILLFFFAPIILLAHPHIFMDTKLTFAVVASKIDSLHISWAMDDMNSQIFMVDYDLNKDKKFNQAETKKLKQSYFDKQFTHIKVGGQNIPLSTQVSDFTVKNNQGLMVIEFDINFKQIKQEKNLEIGFWDDVNYVAFTINEESIIFKGKTLKSEMDFYYADLFVADILRITL